MSEDNKYEDMLNDPCPNCGNYGHLICGFLEKNPRISELEAKNVELEKKLTELEDKETNKRIDLMSLANTHTKAVKYIATLEEKLEIAVEALGRIKYEPLDDKTPVRYIAALMNWRDNVCTVSFEALEKIK